MNPNTTARQPQPATEIGAGARRWLVKNVVYTLVLAAILFAVAGTLDWPGAWVYLALVVLTQVVNAFVLSPELRAERSQLQPGTKRWDLILASGMAAWGPLLLYIVAGLDRRFGWTAPLSGALLPTAAVIALLGGLFTTWAMRANPFFSGTVRIQEERGHRVAASGPYRIMRHPGYVGVLVHYAAAPLIFGSLWAYLPALLVVTITFIRTALEDRTLQVELPGYREYATRVRARLLPGAW